MGKKLVIVDDAAFIREAIRGALNDSEFEVVGEAANGIDAMSVVSSKLPDIVIMDLVMPEKNGVDAIQDILSQFPETKIVACSTMTDKNFLIKAIDAGCSAFIAKPFEKKELLKTLKKVGGE